MTTNVSQNTIETDEQYSLAKIMGIWASVTVPMGLVPWVIVPFLIPRVNVAPELLYL